MGVLEFKRDTDRLCKKKEDITNIQCVPGISDRPKFFEYLYKIKDNFLYIWDLPPLVFFNDF